MKYPPINQPNPMVNQYHHPTKCEFCALAYNMCRRVDRPGPDCGFVRDMHISLSGVEGARSVGGQCIGGRGFGRRV